MEVELVDCSKSVIIKEELFCKSECEVIIDEIEDNTEMCGYPVYHYGTIYTSSRLCTNQGAGKTVATSARPKAAPRYGCIVCEYKTANSTNFKIHLRTHTGEKPYKCDICPYRAKVLCALYRHRRVHTGERPYACDQCAYRAAQPSHLVRHRMIHTGERPHSCTLCDYRASQMSHLVRHMSVHTNYRPFHCDQCPYKAKRKSHLQKHSSTHRKEIEYCARELRSSHAIKAIDEICCTPDKDKVHDQSGNVDEIKINDKKENEIGSPSSRSCESDISVEIDGDDTEDGEEKEITIDTSTIEPLEIRDPLAENI